MTAPKERANWKLTVGKLLAAWRAYPTIRRDLAAFPPGPPIFVTGTHRSGTTWVAKMLAVPGLWYMHEPFNPNKDIWPEAFTYVRPPERNVEVDRVMENILGGGLRQAAHAPYVDHPWMPLRLFRPPMRRLMIKDPLACLLTAYLVEHFDLQTLVLFRHPCGFVASITRLGWPTGGFLRDFLQRPELMGAHLAPFAALMERYSRDTGVKAAAVLHGVLNVVLWDTIQDRGVRWICFENLCESPLEKFQELFTWLRLPYSEDVKLRHMTLCLTGSFSPNDYHPHAVARNSQAMADSWKRQLSVQQVSQIREIWSQFAIPLYDDDRQWRLVNS